MTTGSRSNSFELRQTWRQGGGGDKVMWAMIYRHDKLVRDLVRRVALLEMNEFPIWNLPVPERVSLGMQGLFPE